MTDHRHFLAGLPDETREALTKRADRPGLIRLAAHFSLIAALAVWVGAGWPFWGAALPFLGVALVFLFTLQHECTHKTPFRTPWLNEAVGHLCGLLIVQPFQQFRYFHFAHHRHTGDPERDPELAAGPQRGWRAFWIGLSGWPYWRHNIGALAAAARGRAGPYAPTPARRRIVLEARIMLAIYAAVGGALLVSPLLLWIWAAPLIAGMPALRLYLLAEHGRCPMVADMFDNTRSTRAGAAIRFLAWNMPYHAEHHAFPMAPFHKLPALSRLAAPHLKRRADGYVGFTAHYMAGIGRERDGFR